jgi:hypothetical protein
MAPKSPSQRPARTPRPSLKERLLAARTESTIEKSKKRVAAGRSTMAKKRRTEQPAGQAVEEQEEPTASQADETEPTNHDLISSDGDDDDEYLEEPEEEPVPQSEGEYYETDDDLDYDSAWEGELQEEEQRFSCGSAIHWRIEDTKGKCLRTLVDTTTPNRRLLTPLDLFHYWYQQQLKSNFCGYRFKYLTFKASYDNGDESGSYAFGGHQKA